jgi:hypothetical protein
VDVYRAEATDVAESDLRTAAKRDIGDWFRFDVGPRRPVADGVAGLRLPVVAYVGVTEWTRFHVDLVGSDLRMTGEPENVPALASEARRRGLVLPDRFDALDRKMWDDGYRSEARRSFLPVAMDLDGALAVVRPFLNPLLDGSAAGTWDHAQGAWGG